MKKFILVAALFSSVDLFAQDYKSFPMWNYKLPVEQWVNDLISRLTLEEKVAKMMSHAPGTG